MPTKNTAPKAVKSSPKADPKPVTGTAKVKRPTMRGWKIIPAADVSTSDVVLARYP